MAQLIQQGVVYGDGSLQTTASTQANSVISISQSTISTNYTIASANNGFSVGPVTIANGYSVLVSPGQRWLIV
jgi:hypothetical protein